MGKEHDLLNAAKTGNVSQIEKILGQRGKKSGLQSIIVRSTNPNYQDEMGYTPLHYASLNGHRAAVELLLKYDSSANNPDHSGNYPLHLAAFNGHADVCRVLINSGPSRARVNEQNGTQDTAMHSAAQSKSSQVVAVLLENHADPSLRNCRKESPLDLAAQYGRIENVKLLLSYHPNLLQNNVKTHSPLHLAARNGHIDVVSNLLGCGMAVNFQCDTGTALHEAALFGKLDVCNFLLQCDVDITVKDKNEMTVMDLLMNHPTARTKEISALIYNYTQTTKSRSKSVKGSSQSVREQRISAVPAGNQRASTISFSSSSYDMVPDPAGRRDTYDTVPPHQQQQQPSMYDSVPPPQRQITVDEYLQPRHDMEHNPNEPPRNVGGYSFLTAPGSQTTAVLTPQKVQEGYTLLGIPVSGKSKAIIDSEYSTVRPEGSQMMVSGSPKNAVMDPQRTGTLDPLPSRDMVSKDNLAYYKIEPHTTYEPASPTHTPTTATSSVPEYEVVPRHPLTQRTHDLPVYEVPPAPIFQTRTNQEVRQPEGDYGLIGGAIATPSKPIRQTRKDGSDVSSSPSVYEVPPSFKQREQREQVHGGSPRGAVCPLDISQNDLEDLGYTGINPIGPEAAALATQPGYEYMDRNSPTDIQYEYEVLGPARGFEPRPPQPSSGQYELISMPARHISEGPPKAPLAQSPPIYEIAPTPILAPQKPRAAAPQMAQSPPIYEIAPTPRPRIPDRPAPYSVPQPRPPSDNVPAARAPQQNVPLIGGMEEKEQPPVPPPRPGNEYQPHVPVHDPSRAPNQQGIPPPYEKVRIEAPKGKLNLDQAPTPIVPPRTHLGDYCTIDPSAISPMHPPSKRDQVSSGSSFGSTSEGSDTSDLPSIPPPPASVAEAVVFETLERGNDTPTPTPKQKPVPLPRRESLNDRPKWHVDRNDVKPKPRDLTDDVKQPTHDVITDVKQDPFSNPPNKQNAITEENDEPTNSFFTNLHKQFSPHGSREDLTAEETPEDSKVQPSPLLYENVLFQRSDSTARGSMTKKTEPQAPEVETENAVKVDSVESKHESRLSSDLSNSMDEEAEWEKINQLLLSFEDLGNIAIQIADASVAKTVPEWLKALGVEQYETDLMNDGFDDLDFLNGGVLEDQDLLDIGVTDLSHRKIILEAAKSLPTPPRVAKLDNPPSTVEEWLKLIKLTDYLDVFIHRGFATMERVKMLWEVELTSVLEINCLGHRNRILTSLIEPRRMTMLRKSRQTSEIDSKGNFGLDEKLAELKAFCPDEEPAKVVSSLDSDILNKIADDMINDEGLRRKTLEKRKQKQWRHEPKVLLKGSVNYTTQYLGSQTVKEIVGVKSTVDACRKMKLSTAKLKKIPSVTLAVSVNGIKFIDSRTQLVISNHEMNNVSYITQDPENRRIFAYIAKDAKANRHYCHVFRVDDLAMSDEITMTIGQAFELAFEQFLQIQSLISSQKS